MGTHRRTGRLTTALVAAVVAVVMGAGFAARSSAQTPAPYVRVFVDGALVPFDQPPVIDNGRVLVPLRGVFERLGAGVTWAPASETVLAQRGATSVSLQIGSPQAFVNGQPQTLDVPAMLVGGRTMVPLRFVSQALGAGVAWDAATSTVQIASQAAAAAPPAPLPPSVSYPSAAPPPPAAAVQTITGTVSQVNASTYPGQLAVQTPDGAVYTYQIVSGTAITRVNTTTGVTAPVALTAIVPGDAVTVTADQSGTAQSIQTSFAAVTGTIASIGYNQIVLQDGRTYALSPGVRVIRGGAATTVAALQPGDVATLRLDPSTGRVSGVSVRRAAAAPGGIASVTVTPAGRQLVASDVMTVVAAGPPRGTATFTITGLRAGLPMTESVNQPGTYVGTYAIQPGDYAANTTVVVTMTAPDGRLLTATAPAAVSINATAAVPPAGGMPVIASPAPGSGITTPFTVMGTAPPGALVKVEADYTGSVLLFNVHGTLGSQTVTADGNGRWSATFAQRPPVAGVNVTISAVLVDSTGAALSPYSTVNTTLQ
jgi:hypothetical protein